MRPSVSASQAPPALPATWIAPPGKRESARARSTVTPPAAMRSASGAALPSSPCTVTCAGAGCVASVRGAGFAAPGA